MHVKKGMNESKYIENLPKAQCAVICRQEAQKNGEKREGGFIGTAYLSLFSPFLCGFLPT